MKKLFIFSIVALIIVLIFFIAYQFVFEGSVSLSNLIPKKTSVPKKTTFELEKIHRLSQNSISSPTVDDTGSRVLFYDNSDDVLKSISFDSSLVTEISEKNTLSLNNLWWSPSTKFFLFSNSSGLFQYNRKEQVTTKLKDNIDFAVWSNVDNKIIYKYFDPATKERSINMAAISGEEWQKISDLAYKKVSIAPIPQSSLISFWNYPDKFVASALTIINPLDGEKITLFENRKGSDYLWSPNGNGLLSSFVENNSLILSVSGQHGEEVIDLKSPTLVSKCVWSNDNITVFCAMPSNVPTDAIMPNDYLNKKILTKDTFWKINTKTGEKNRLVELEEIKESIDASNLFLSPSEDILFFVNRHNNSLYRISL
ncbi:MAG: hypothetical protein OEV93_04165 [Candidatus Moranbacteria bacterium]|nr:hypothetical protein [Candidatus Moranbacteria bacterium]